MALFDPAETFNDDYLWFYDASLSDERNQIEADEILGLLDSTEPLSILDPPCGHGRIANLLAATGHDVVGVDVIELFLSLVAVAAVEAGVQVDYRLGDLRQLPVDPASRRIRTPTHTVSGCERSAARQRHDDRCCYLRPGHRSRRN